jgi:hypothetical protein
LTRKAQTSDGKVPLPSFMGATYASKGLHDLANKVRENKMKRAQAELQLQIK